jgi:hypothetical protein
VLPVTTNMLVPSLATPPWPQMAVVAHPATLEGLLMSTPTTPAVIVAAITEVPRVRYVHMPVHQRQSAPFFLREGHKVDAIVTCGRIHVDRPTRRCKACVHVQRMNEMLSGLPLIKASKKTRREFRSATGVPVMPVGLKPPQGVVGTGGPISVRD